MNAAFCISFLLLVIPVTQALPTEHQPTGAPTDSHCALNLQVSNENEIHGVFETSDVKITFQAIKKDGEIHATATTLSPSDVDSTISVHLSLPDIEGRIVPNIEKLIVQRAVDLVESSNCKIPTNLNVLHEELADKLYQCTKEMGMSQLRFSIMYLETVVASAQRVCNGAESICTASPKYTYGQGLFMCEEDLEELYPGLMESTQGDEKKSVGGESKIREKRLLFGRCPQGLLGTDDGCCGYYAGRCYVCSLICFYHDRLCAGCDYWHCGCEFSGRQPV